MRAAVASDTPVCPLSARDTLAIDRPTACATSYTVTIECSRISKRLRSSYVSAYVHIDDDARCVNVLTQTCVSLETEKRGAPHPLAHSTPPSTPLTSAPARTTVAT